MIEYRQTRNQVPRGARPDAETHNRIYLIKNVSLLRATYQVRLLAFRAVEARKKLVIRIPESCKLAPSLSALRREIPAVVVIERV